MYNYYKKYLIESIYKNVKQVISEMAYNNLPFDDFCQTMKDLGFVKRNSGRGSGYMFTIKTDDGKEGNINLHYHQSSNRIPANTLVDTFHVLNDLGWFNNPKNMKKFPFEKWGLNAYKQQLKIDTSQDDIRNANNQYEDAIIVPLFPMKNSICSIEVNGKFNLCRGVNDKRPLLDKWYDKCEPSNNNNDDIMYMKLDNYNTLETECYPINSDGTLDTENVIIENKLFYGKNLS